MKMEYFEGLNMDDMKIFNVISVQFKLASNLNLEKFGISLPLLTCSIDSWQLGMNNYFLIF